jgi:hypothetical protein
MKFNTPGSNGGMHMNNLAEPTDNGLKEGYKVMLEVIQKEIGDLAISNSLAEAFSVTALQRRAGQKFPTTVELSKIGPAAIARTFLAALQGTIIPHQELLRVINELEALDYRGEEGDAQDDSVRRGIEATIMSLRRRL